MSTIITACGRSLSRSALSPLRLRQSSAPAVPIASSCDFGARQHYFSTTPNASPSSSSSSSPSSSRSRGSLLRGQDRKNHSSLANNNNVFPSSLSLSPSSSSSSSPRKSFAHPAGESVRTNFSYAGPRKLADILKTELLHGKSSAEISDLWMTYHEGKEKVHGLTLDGDEGKSLLSRAAQCPFFIHPVFREEGHFMIISQFQTPNHFLLAFLEDYQMDPARAQPLLTISLFDDYAKGKGVTLVRCDIINRAIEDDEGYKICKYLLEDYSDDGNFGTVHMFNKTPDVFDVEKFVKEKEQQWKSQANGSSLGKGEEGKATDAASEKKSCDSG